MKICLSNVTQLACHRGETQPQVYGTLVFWVWEGTSNIGSEHSVVAYFLLLEIGCWEEVGSTWSIILSGVWWQSAQQGHARELFKATWTPLFLMRFYLDLLSKSRLYFQLTSPFYCSFPHGVYPRLSLLSALTKEPTGFASLALPDWDDCVVW